ncbi:flagellar basal body rod protein FlgC [Rhodobacterales bacterium HKCCE2091]|nr:flagellar basal body rod protein FlgC [Rhodobacterales bacterium HKCCE2091]
MNDFTATLAIAASGMASQSGRLRLVSENIANADTPGYHRKLASFEPLNGADDVEGMVALGRVQLDRTDLATIYDPSHPMAGTDGTYRGSNVNMVIEIADAREAQRSYEANMRIFDQVRQMSSSLNDLLRR